MRMQGNYQLGNRSLTTCVQSWHLSKGGIYRLKEGFASYNQLCLLYPFIFYRSLRFLEERLVFLIGYKKVFYGGAKGEGRKVAWVK